MGGFLAPRPVGGSYTTNGVEWIRQSHEAIGSFLTEVRKTLQREDISTYTIQQRPYRTVLRTLLWFSVPR